MIPRSEALRLRVSEHPKDIFFARVVGLITLAPENLKVFHIILGIWYFNNYIG